MTKKRTGKRKSTIAENLAIIERCFLMVAKEETKPKNMQRIHAVRAGMVATYLIAGAIDPILMEYISKCKNQDMKSNGTSSDDAEPQ